MRVLNIHQRKLEASPERVGKLLDSLSSSSDLLWPSETWVPMIFDRPLTVGATGGHGPIRYTVESYTPGQSVQFRFLAPEGFDGVHRFDITPADENSCILRHTIDMKASGRPLVKWLLVIRPLHDALIEECLSKAQSSKPNLPWAFFPKKEIGPPG